VAPRYLGGRGYDREPSDVAAPMHILLSGHARAVDLGRLFDLERWLSLRAPFFLQSIESCSLHARVRDRRHWLADSTPQRSVIPDDGVAAREAQVAAPASPQNACSHIKSSGEADP